MVGVEAPTLRDSIEYALAPQFFGAAPHQSVRFTDLDCGTSLDRGTSLGGRRAELALIATGRH
jgi:hypothetical protein